MANRITWKCIIPGCTSPARAPGHYFPKNKELREKWVEAISVNLPDEKIQNCRICHLHFDKNSYVFTIQRRRLKYDAIPTRNLSITVNETDISQCNTSTILEEGTFEMDTQYDEMTETVATPSFLDIYKSFISNSAVKEENAILENNVNIEEEKQQETQPCNNVNIEERTRQETQPEIVRTPNRSFHFTSHVCCNILDSVT